MSDMEREGCILIDEMSVLESYSFNKESLDIIGFTDLGRHTPANQTTKLGDHALVVMYQPLSSQWVQPIAAFLSKGATSSEVLYHIILESTVLLENSNFRVNAIISDGAQWNRGMWALFGVTEDKIHTDHITDSARKLWFTPDGKVKIAHWKELLKAESNRFKLRACYKLREEHIHPKSYNKMNVTLAYQFFDGTVADSMDLYKSNKDHQEVLQDCEPTCKFIRRIRRVIKSMSSRTPKGALRPEPIDSSERKEIEDFIHYLTEWRDMSLRRAAEQEEARRVAEDEQAPPPKKKRKKRAKNVSSPFDRPISSTHQIPGFLTNNTLVGFLVTLKVTLQILEYLTKERNFKYLMTARLNQDNLEKFFGMIRSAGGTCDHPDSSRFPYLFKLLSSYSLIKAPKGSNVPNEEFFSTFCHLMDENKVNR